MFIQFTGRVEYIPNDLEMIALPAATSNYRKINVLPAGNRPEITVTQYNLLCSCAVGSQDLN